MVSLQHAVEEVLYVSVDPWRRTQVSHVLENAGYSVRVFASPMEFMRYVARRCRGGVGSLGDLLLLDGTLDGSLGAVEILRSLRNAGIQARSIVLAGMKAHEDVIDCLRLGADDFINVPAQPSEMLEVVGRVLALPRII